MSPPISFWRNLNSPSNAPLSYHHRLTTKYKEEGPAETVKLGQADKYNLTDFKENLKALDDSSEIQLLTELLLLSSKCQAFTSMGNQQGMRIKQNFHSHTENWNTLPKSPRIQIPRKRRKRTEGLVHAGTLQHNLNMTPGTPRVLTKARRLTKLHITSSPTFRETQDSEEEKDFNCTPAVRRKRVVERSVSKLEERKRDPQGSWRAKQSVPSPVEFPTRFNKKGLLTHREDLSVKGRCVPADSDTDLSDYDNEIYSMCISPTSFETQRRKEDSDIKLPEAQIAQAAKQKHEEVKAGGLQSFDEMGKEAAERRVMGKIEEVEGIIRRVSLSSLDWTKGGIESNDELQSVSGDEISSETLQQLQILQQRCQTEFSTDPQLETQDKGSNEDKPLLVEELLALGEALSKSLQQALRMEEERQDLRLVKGQSELLTEARKSLWGSSKTNLTPYPQHYSTVPNKSSSPSLTASAAIFPIPSPSLSAIRDVSLKRSHSFEELSPIHPPPSSLNVTDQQEEDHQIEWTGSVEDCLIPWGIGSVTTFSSGTKNDPSKRKEHSAQVNLNHTQTDRCNNERVDSQDYLLSSGKNSNNGSLTIIDKNLIVGVSVAAPKSQANMDASCQNPTFNGHLMHRPIM